MSAAWTFVLHVLNTMPAWLSATLVGWAISAGLTQTVKFILPVRWDYDGRELAARLLAFLSAFIPAGIYYAEQASATPGVMILVMIGAGLWSPIAFALLQRVLSRYFPWLADVLSADKRGVLGLGPADGGNP